MKSTRIRVDGTKQMLQMAARVGLILNLLIVGALGGVIVGFRKEDGGGAATAAAGMALVVLAFVAAGRNHLRVAAVSGGPFLAARTPFIASARREQRNVR